MTPFVLEIRWWLRIGDAKPSSNFKHKLRLQIRQYGHIIQEFRTWQKTHFESSPSVVKHPGGRLNKKDGLTRYGNSHVKDKTS